MVDSNDIYQRRGYGVVVNSLYVRSTKVWGRPDIPEINAPNDSEQSSLGQAYTPTDNPQIGKQDLLVTFDPDLTPETVLIEIAREIEAQHSSPGLLGEGVCRAGTKAARALKSS